MVRRKLQEFFFSIRIAWLKYWTLQRRFVFDNTSVSFRRALTYFVVVLCVIYFVIGLPILSVSIYGKKAEGFSLSVASTIYPLPVATVGGEVILLKPYADRLAYLKFFSQQTQQQIPGAQELRRQVVDKLVDESIIRQWANREGITVTRDDIDAAYQKIVQDRGSESDVRTVLSQLYNLSETEFKRLIPDLLYREKVERILLQRVNVRHILVSSESTAKQVHQEATPENFPEKAKQFSEDKATRDTNGDLGLFDRCRAEKLAPELAQAFFTLEPGKVSEPIKTQYGYHIIYITEKTGNEQKCFDEWLQDRRSKTKVRKFLY